MATFADGTAVPKDGQYHVDPTNPMVQVRYLESWYPPGVTDVFSGGGTACLGLLSDGRTLLKYVRDREDRHARNSLQVEQAILSVIGQHDRIVKYLGEHGHGILLERACNGDIKSYLSQWQPDISLQLRQKWAIQAAEALVFIHSKGVIHCDLHPNNFLLDEQLNARLCDFAGSLFKSWDGGAMESTRFFLPRDWRDPPNVVSDLFALGSVMYYIFTGHEPYEDLSDNEVSAKYERKEFPDVTMLGCGRAIRGCWTGDLKTAEDVLQAVLDSIAET